MARFNALEREKIRHLKTKDGYDPWIVLRVGRLCMAQAELMPEMCDSRATTAQGHRARALSFALWDEGNLAWRAANGEAIEDLFLHALVRDLTRGLGR